MPVEVERDRRLNLVLDQELQRFTKKLNQADPKAASGHTRCLPQTLVAQPMFLLSRQLWQRRWQLCTYIFEGRHCGADVIELQPPRNKLIVLDKRVVDLQ